MSDRRQSQACSRPGARQIYNCGGHALKGCVLAQGQVKDASGNVNVPMQPLLFLKTADSLLEPTSFRILKSPGLLSLT